MSFDENRRRFNEWLAAIDARDGSLVSAMIDEWVADDYVFHNGGSTLSDPPDVVGRDGLRAHTRTAFETFGTMQHVVEEEFGDDERLVTRASFRATVKSDFLGIAAAGREIACSIIYISHFRNGQIREGWVDWDSLLAVSAKLATTGQAS